MTNTTQEDRRTRIVAALKRAEPCELYYVGDGCDGLVGGCERCLALAADAILNAQQEAQ